MDMGKEINLLLCCTHKEVATSRKEQTQPWLQKGIDWTYLIELAQGHGMIPLLYRTLKTNFAEWVPPAILEELNRRYLWNLRSSLFLTGELLKLLNRFQENGIPVVPLKGPTLATFLYGHPGMRTYGDLDLLFQKKDVSKAKKLLVSRGYCFSLPLSLPLSETQKKIYLQSEAEACLIRNNREVSVEVLWGTPGDFPIALDFAPFWKRLEKQSFEGQAILTFSPEDWILYLSLHQATHGWSRLLWLTDLDALIHSHPRMDWDTLVGRAEQLRCRRVLFISLALIHSFLQTPLPEQVQETLKADERVQCLARIAGENLFREGQTALGRYREALFFLRVTDRWRDRIRFCILQAMMPTVVDWLAWPLSRPLFSLYYFFHPLRIGWNLSRRFMKSIFPASAEKVQ